MVTPMAAEKTVGLVLITPTQRRNNWYVRKRLELIDQFGGKCQECGDSNDLEFAHVKPTDVVGLGRGRNRRVLDVLKNPTHYRLLCHPCHKSYDARDARSEMIELVSPQREG